MTVVLLLLAVYRATLLVTSDRITAKPRRWFVETVTGQRRHQIRGVELLSKGIAGPGYGEMWRASCSCGEFSADLPAATNTSADAFALVETHAVNSFRLDHPLALWIGCPWCVSMWLAVPAAWSWRMFSGRAWWDVPAAILAASGVTGALASHAAPDDGE